MCSLAVVAGAGGFIGGHLVKHLLDLGNQNVRAIDSKPFEEWFQRFDQAENLVLNLSEKNACYVALENATDCYNLACDMGGMGFIEANKARCMLSVLINTHLLMAARDHKIQRYFYSSSACVYNQSIQKTPDVVALRESDAYPADPESGYGWEKLFSERMCMHFSEDFGLSVRIGRFHNVYGPHGSWYGGREKAPAAICRKVISAKYNGSSQIEIWGDGTQTRSFMYIDDCIEGIDRLMRSDFQSPLNIGSSELVSINQLVTFVEELAKVKLRRVYKPDAPKGVNGRNSDNELIIQTLGWVPSTKLRNGLVKTYAWIEEQYLLSGAIRLTT